jgi:hypothetical protein
MGTRGFITFAVDGQNKTAYNHFDSYPDGLGVEVLRFLRDASHAAVRKQAQALRVVTDKDKPTAEDVAHLQPWTDMGVGNQSTDDWYCLLRETQGDPAAMLEAGVIEDASGFPANSLFAEWGYVIDLDGDGRFEVYEGFQHSPHNRGRFAGMTGGSDGYAPVALRAAWPLAQLPSEAEFLSATESSDED